MALDHRARIAHRDEIRIVIGQQEAALTGFGVEQRNQHICESSSALSAESGDRGVIFGLVLGLHKGRRDRASTTKNSAATSAAR